MALPSLLRLLPRAGLKPLLGVASSPLSRPYWWGHDSAEVEERKRLKLEKAHKPVTWSDPGKEVTVTKEFTYTPKRYEQEAEAVDSGFNDERFNQTDMHQWLSQPVPFFSFNANPTYWEKHEMLATHRDLISSQSFNRDAILHLGPDLAAAYFLVSRNCRVRFKDHDDWAVWKPKSYTIEGVPTIYEPGWYIEAIDASGALLVYEGFNTLRNLICLKYLDLSYCEYVDAWCLDRITGEYGASLEYLDLSGCVSVNWNGLECLWRLENLKTLVLYDLDHIQDLPLICLMLLEIFPNLDIKGVDYINPALLEGTEHAHLLEDLDEMRLLEEGAGKTEENSRKGQDNIENKIKKKQTISEPAVNR